MVSIGDASDGAFVDGLRRDESRRRRIGRHEWNFSPWCVCGRRGLKHVGCFPSAKTPSHAVSHGRFMSKHSTIALSQSQDPSVVSRRMLDSRTKGNFGTTSPSDIAESIVLFVTLASIRVLLP